MNSWIYVVDDDDLVADSIKAYLEMAGYQVRCFAEAPTFLQTLPVLPPGCVLFDLQMPVMGGVEAATRFAAAGYDWPIIIMSARIDDIPATLPFPLADVIEKPFMGEGMLEILQRHLDPRQALASGA
ncbi:response regulator [Sphingosinicella sp. BN140058]|uniref:response regulator n=1 Tax=Sphingosinicella sp. BN140058 TaxID=1892855 RepID=UPI001012A602|nr:response regulator [Sphingosinicella sp. BN140058]QAY77957.1 response regulator [Sphingosinicella sp. BN140058]